MKKRLFIILLVVINIMGMVSHTAIAMSGSAVYQQNDMIYSSKATDKATLDYYKRLYQTDEEDVKSLAASITAGLKSDYDKIRAVHNWVSHNIWYDKDAANNPSYAASWPSIVIENRRGVCDGYARLTAYLLVAVDIPAKHVVGYTSEVGGGAVDTTSTSENHAWNEAFCDGRWIILDTTWDSRNKYENGVYSHQQANTSKYFDISLEELSKTHRYSDYVDYCSIDGFLIDNSTYTLQWLFNFYENDLLTDIKIPDGVKAIGGAAFNGCENLTTVTIPSSVTSIYDYAFNNCHKLSVVIIPDSVTYIGINAFGWNGSNTNLIIYGSIGSYADRYARDNTIPFVPDPPVNHTPSSWAI